MLTMHASRAITKWKTNWETNVLREPSTCNILHINLLINGNHHNQGFYISTSPWKCGGQIKGSSPSNISNLATLKRRLMHVSASSDDEYRSSRNIAVSLFRRYRNVIERGGGDNLKEFISAGVNAYALGCTDEGLRKELIDMRESGVEIEAMQTYGGNTGLKSKIFSEEVDECILWVSIIFITILCTPQPTIVRWSSTPPVSADIMVQWKGFCALIANAYYMKGMAWLPVKTLQLEQMAVIGRAEEPSVVASRMRLVFSTLEVVSPQWPRV
ncbi:PREDICTED: uncharacterized protein LOC104612759 [Nelumbo nucifera]|uniref:Uncharacterized protein LOC104612759 n=1 Tax=Nelumbo nucifera TaxID=4432 RepID=A0A1U8BBG8_NELNU|nr:PREDICTED: uncharacterized protein LOC104612759 [Nelumbo nucifera]XP_010278632.1 PREDICTED: uncharacterized protein LOC104612759 [Nelumbo nucifera]